MTDKSTYQYMVPPPSESKNSKQKTIYDLAREAAEFSNKTFGDDKVRDETGALHHLKMEVGELIENTNDDMEWADCFLLILDAARRKGHTVDDLIKFSFEKLEINKKRTWSKTENGVYLHNK